MKYSYKELKSLVKITVGCLLFIILAVLVGCCSSKPVEEPPVDLRYYHETIGKAGMDSIKNNSAISTGKKRFYADIYNSVDEYFEKHPKPNSAPTKY